MNLRKIAIAAIATSLVLGSPAVAGNKLIASGQRVKVAKSTMTVQPNVEWNKMGARPGRNSETWTLDGDGLNDLTFYGGIESGRPLFREVDKKNTPLPKVSSTMLLTDIPALLENSYRVALQTSAVQIDAVQPVQFAGTNGVRFTYSFSHQNETLRRRGEARAAMIGGKLYMVTYEAPALYYYDRSYEAFRAAAESVKL
jgi:hypothetical protein